MRQFHTFTLFVLGTVLHFDLPASPKDQRVQLWQSASEEPLPEESFDPTIRSIKWKNGDLEVLFTQAAPCGAWLPVNPVWEVKKFKVVLNYT